jgi:hypothetical protein
MRSGEEQPTEQQRKCRLPPWFGFGCFIFFISFPSSFETLSKARELLAYR